MRTTSSQHSASFRDPAGFLYRQNGTLLRQVNQTYRPDYERLLESGLYASLVAEKALIPHQEVDALPAAPQTAYRILQPEPIPFVSYPYEWSFSQLKDAALLTLSIQKTALAYDMSLKDASAYNVQFYQGRPILIDTLSLEIYPQDQPWVAYRQFCRHFLAPLALMAWRDVRLGKLLRDFIDGVPLDLASRLLPLRTYFNFGLLSHLHLHASAEKRAAASGSPGPARSRQKVTKPALLALVDHLDATIRGLRWSPTGTPWGDYALTTSYSQTAREHKAQVVRSLLEKIRPSGMWDIGANTGYYSRLAAGSGIPTISFDLDEAAVEKNYREVRAKNETNLLPLVLDLTNPSPAIGWQNQERASWLERGPVDAVLALALIHHLAIANNVPLPDLANFFARIGRHAIVEFIPKEDPQVQVLLRTRKDIFPDYTLEGFEQAFSPGFFLRERVPIEGSQRILYWLERREAVLSPERVPLS